MGNEKLTTSCCSCVSSTTVACNCSVFFLFLPQYFSSEELLDASQEIDAVDLIVPTQMINKILIMVIFVQFPCESPIHLTGTINGSSSDCSITVAG